MCMDLKTLNTIWNIVYKNHKSKYLTVDSFFRDNQEKLISHHYTNLLNRRILLCTDTDLTDRALSYKKYLIEVMGVSKETSSRCTLDLYFKDKQNNRE